MYAKLHGFYVETSFFFEFKRRVFSFATFSYLCARFYVYATIYSLAFENKLTFFILAL